MPREGDHEMSPVELDQMECRGKSQPPEMFLGQFKLI
jgi:hypothetical protein